MTQHVRQEAENHPDYSGGQRETGADTSPLMGIVCASCHAVNRAGSLICGACGVSLADVSTALPRLREQQLRGARIHAHEAALSAQARAKLEIERGQLRLRRDLFLAVLVLCLVGLLAVGGAWLYGGHIREQRERTDAQYAQAQGELAVHDYRAARDRLLALLRVEPEYPGARAGVRDARLGLAQQLASVRQWKKAADELLTVLREAPEDEETTALLKEIFDRWYEDAQDRGDRMDALEAQVLRAWHFGPRRPVTPVPTASE